MYTVLVIDDSASMRRVIKDMINSIDDFEVVDTAIDAQDARAKIKQLEPDLVTIDINMPGMNGVTFLRNLMKLHPMPAVVVSGESVRGSDIFDDGAVGFVAKPATGEVLQDFQDRIKDTLLTLTFLLSRYTLKKPKPITPLSKQVKKIELVDGIESKIHPDKVYPSRPALMPGGKIIAIGSSTGGVESLLTVFKGLTSNLPPIVMTQHIPYGFSSSFAQRLNDSSEVKVQEVNQDGIVLERGNAYLAPGNMHLVIEKQAGNYVTKLLDITKVSRHKPSVDMLFRSVNNSAGGGAMAVMMTGMGDDGCIAMQELFKNRAYCVAQSEETCVVFGMPKKVIEAKAIHDIVDLQDISSYIIDFAKNKRKA